MQSNTGPLSDDLLRRLRERALREAELLDAIEDARRAGDISKVWDLTEQLVKLADAAKVCA